MIFSLHSTDLTVSFTRICECIPGRLPYIELVFALFEDGMQHQPCRDTGVIPSDSHFCPPPAARGSLFLSRTAVWGQRPPACLSSTRRTSLVQFDDLVPTTELPPRWKHLPF